MNGLGAPPSLSEYTVSTLCLASPEATLHDSFPPQFPDGHTTLPPRCRSPQEIVSVGSFATACARISSPSQALIGATDNQKAVHITPVKYTVRVVPHQSNIDTPNESRRKGAAERSIQSFIYQRVWCLTSSPPSDAPKLSCKGRDGGMVGELGRGAAAPPPPVPWPKKKFTTHGHHKARRGSGAFPFDNSICGELGKTGASTSGSIAFQTRWLSTEGMGSWAANGVRKGLARG